MQRIEAVKNGDSPKTEEVVYKYSSKGTGILRESVTIMGIPYYIKKSLNERLGYDVITIEPKIEEKTKIFRPPFDEECPFIPYDFKTAEEPNQYLQRAKKETVDSIYRNKIIEKISHNFLSETKEHKHFYENKGNYNYKSLEHYKQFFELLEAAGLLKLKSEDTQREENPYNTDGFYHKISIPKEKILAKFFMEELVPEEIEKKDSLGLGGMEVNL
jgi:hypothetical protein